MNEAFFQIHHDLPREGPGEPADVAWAISIANPPEDARMLDAGCGPGPDIAALLDARPKGHVTAVDTHADFIETVAARHDDPRVAGRQSDMRDVTGPFDFIWSAGAVYFLGVTEALTLWRDALAPGGAVAFSQICRFDTLPEDAGEWWDVAYPDLTDEAGIRAQIAAAGFDTLATRHLSDDAWAAYHGPLQARIDALADGADADLRAAIAETRAEIDLHDRTGATWGYLLSVVRPA